jgi:hypothetical protein
MRNLFQSVKKSMIGISRLLTDRKELIWKLSGFIAGRKQLTAFSDLLFILLLDAAVELKSVLAEVTTIIVFSLHGTNEIIKLQWTVGLLLVQDMYVRFPTKVPRSPKLPAAIIIIIIIYAI